MKNNSIEVFCSGALYGLLLGAATAATIGGSTISVISGSIVGGMTMGSNILTIRNTDSKLFILISFAINFFAAAGLVILLTGSSILLAIKFAATFIAYSVITIIAIVILVNLFGD